MNIGEVFRYSSLVDEYSVVKLRLDDRAWSIILNRIYEAQKKVAEKIYNYISLRPPYSASVTTILRCYTRVRNDLKYGRVDPLPYSPNMIMGLIFDFACKVALQGYPPPELYRVKRLKEEDVFLIHADPDALVDGEIIELKYTSMPFDKLPLEHHELQLKMYMNILSGRGRLVYLTPSGVREYLYEENEALSDYEILKIAKEFFVEKKSPRYEWECGYCPYKTICPLSKFPKQEKEESGNSDSGSA